jgi:hypothetical protein
MKVTSATVTFVLMAVLLAAAPGAAQSPTVPGEGQVLCVSVVAPASDLPIEPGDALPEGLVVTVLEPEACIPPPAGTSYDDFAVFQEEVIGDLEDLAAPDDADIEDPEYRAWWGDIRSWAANTASSLKGIVPQACYQEEYDALREVTKTALTASKTMLKAMSQYDDEEYSKGLRTLKTAKGQVSDYVDARGVLDETYDRDACELIEG